MQRPLWLSPHSSRVQLWIPAARSSSKEADRQAGDYSILGTRGHEPVMDGVVSPRQQAGLLGLCCHHR